MQAENMGKLGQLRTSIAGLKEALQANDARKKDSLLEMEDISYNFNQNVKNKSSYFKKQEKYKKDRINQLLKIPNPAQSKFQVPF